MTVGQFFLRLVSELQHYPPALPLSGELDEASFGDWLAAHLSVEELEVLRKFEDSYGANEADDVVVAAFLCAGLQRPVRKKK